MTNIPILYIRGLSILCISLLIAFTGCNSPTQSGSDQTSQIEVAIPGSFSNANIPPAQKIGPGVLEAIANGEKPDLVISLNADLPKGLEKRKNAVAAVQDKVLELVTGSEFEVTHSFNTVAALAGKGNSQAAVRRLAADKRVRKIDLDVGGEGSLLTSVPLINADDRHLDGNRGEGVTVAVLDSGLDSDHPDLVGALVHEACFGGIGSGDDGFCPDGSARQVGSGSAEDDHFHGTHVSAIVASRGVIGGVGVAPAANIAALKVLDAGNSFYRSSEIVAALDYIADNPGIGVDVINMSLGTNALFPGVCDAATAWAETGAEVVNLLRENGIVVFASAGNNGSTTGMGFPACLGNVISVGASDNSDQPASFTNSNSETDVFAPGVNIVAANLGGGTRTVSGTSMASPTVAGCAALLVEVGDATTSDEIEERIKDSDVFITRDGLMFPRLDCKVNEVINVAPVLVGGSAEVTVVEGALAANNGTFSDADGDPVILSASIGTVSNDGDGNWAWAYDTVDGPVESQVVVITASDGINDVQSIDFELEVTNANPIVQMNSPIILASGSEYTLNGSFSDAGVNDGPWNWSVMWGDGTQSQGSTPDQTAPIITNKNVCAAGDYTVTFEVTDKDGGIGLSQTLITVERVPVEVRIASSDQSKPINTKSGGRLPVMILGSTEFNVENIDVASLLVSSEYGSGVPVAQKPNGTYFTSITDINDDGISDLLVYVEVNELADTGNLTSNTNELIVIGSLSGDCIQFEGKDFIQVIQ